MWLYLILLVLFNCVVSKHHRKYEYDSDSSGSKERRYTGDLIYLQIMTTNGFHAPLELYPTDKNTGSAWFEGLKKLTSLGKLQMFQLGKVLRKRYDDFITTDPKEVEIYTSAEDRAISSALCLLATLYAPTKEWRFAPHFNWQPLPVTFLDGYYDKYFGYSPICPKLGKQIKKILKSDAAKQYIAQDEFLYSYWSNHSGIELNNWNDVARLYDVLNREEKCDLPVPSWAKAYWKEMERIASAAYKFNFDTKFSIKAKIGPLIDLMVDRMRAKTMEDDPNPEVKLHVYVTHDWNMASFLISLFRFNGLIPPPAATVAVELYRYFDTYTVRMLFFNSSTPELGIQEPNVLTIRGCAEYCPLAYVTNYFKDYIPKDWYKVCGLRLKREEEAADESGRPFSLSDNKAKA